MSGQLGTTTHVRKARKDHRCFWCGEQIERGQSYIKWTWQDDSLTTIKVHPECRDAWHRVSKVEGYPYETGPYENQRGKPDE